MQNGSQNSGIQCFTYCNSQCESFFSVKSIHPQTLVSFSTFVCSCSGNDTEDPSSPGVVKSLSHITQKHGCCGGFLKQGGLRTRQLEVCVGLMQDGTW